MLVYVLYRPKIALPKTVPSRSIAMAVVYAPNGIIKSQTEHVSCLIMHISPFASVR